MRCRTTRATSLLAAGLIVAVAAACDEGDAPAQGGSARTAARPPAAPEATFPPLVVEIAGRRVALAGIGGCVSRGGATTCSASTAPRCPSPTLPAVSVGTDRRLTLILTGRPRALSLTAGDAAPVTLAPARRVTTRLPSATGPLVALVNPRRGGDLIYAGCLEPTP